MSERMDVTNMMWQPELLKLTQIGNPDWFDGEPTACYVTPQSITRISRSVAAFPMREDPTKRHADIQCTEVFYCHGTLHVTESPEEVARLRDKALGHELPKPKAV